MSTTEKPETFEQMLLDNPKTIQWVVDELIKTKDLEGAELFEYLGEVNALMLCIKDRLGIKTPNNG